MCSVNYHQVFPILLCIDQRGAHGIRFPILKLQNIIGLSYPQNVFN